MAAVGGVPAGCEISLTSQCQTRRSIHSKGLLPNSLSGQKTRLYAATQCWTRMRQRLVRESRPGSPGVNGQGGRTDDASEVRACIGTPTAAAPAHCCALVPAVKGLACHACAKMRRNWGTNWDNHLQGRQLPLARDAWKENTLHWPHTAVSSVNSDSPRFTYVISPRPFCRPSLHALTSGLARKQRLVTRRQQRHHLLPGRPLHPSIAPIRRRAATSIARAPSQTDTAREPSARERRPPPTMVQDMPPKGGYEPVQYKVRGGFGLR